MLDKFRGGQSHTSQTGFVAIETEADSPTRVDKNLGLTITDPRAERGHDIGQACFLPQPMHGEAIFHDNQRLLAATFRQCQRQVINEPLAGEVGWEFVTRRLVRPLVNLAGVAAYRYPTGGELSGWPGMRSGMAT